MSVQEILAVDPGGLTGIVRGLRPEPGVMEPLEWWELGQQETCDLIVQWCWSQRARGPSHGSVLVIERYWPQGGPKNFHPESLEIIGVARWAAKRSAVRFVMQNAGDMKDHARAEAVKLYPKIGRGGKGHAKDALGHFYLYA